MLVAVEPLIIPIIVVHSGTLPVGARYQAIRIIKINEMAERMMIFFRLLHVFFVKAGISSLDIISSVRESL